jgi:hypothetical protein
MNDEKTVKLILLPASNRKLKRIQVAVKVINEEMDSKSYDANMYWIIV